MVQEQNRQYFAQKKRQVEEERKRDNTKLEDLIAEINATVNKVVGDSDEESEYIEEEKLPYDYKQFRERLEKKKDVRGGRKRRKVSEEVEEVVAEEEEEHEEEPTPAKKQEIQKSPFVLV